MSFYRSKLYSEERCLEYLFQLRYPNIQCKACNRKKSFHRDRKKQSFTCNCGKTHIFPRKGTIFGSSHLPLLTWIHAIFLLSRTKGRMPAQEVGVYLNVSYPTAWRMKNIIMKTLELDAETSPARWTFQTIMKKCATTDMR